MNEVEAFDMVRLSSMANTCFFALAALTVAISAGVAASRVQKSSGPFAVSVGMVLLGAIPVLGYVLSLAPVDTGVSQGLFLIQDLGMVFANLVILVGVFLIGGRAKGKA